VKAAHRTAAPFGPFGNRALLYLSACLAATSGRLACFGGLRVFSPEHLGTGVLSIGLAWLRQPSRGSEVAGPIISAASPKPTAYPLLRKGQPASRAVRTQATTARYLYLRLGCPVCRRLGASVRRRRHVPCGGSDGDGSSVASFFRATDAGVALLSFAYTPKPARTTALLHEGHSDIAGCGPLFVKRFRRSLGSVVSGTQNPD
jgi:hypothetical protein